MFLAVTTLHDGGFKVHRTLLSVNFTSCPIQIAGWHAYTSGERHFHSFTPTASGILALPKQLHSVAALGLQGASQKPEH